MVAPSKVATPAAKPASMATDFQSEHIYIESEDSTNPAAAARTLRESVVLRNPIRHTGAELALFEEGFLKVTATRQSNADQPFYLDLRFVDPVPKLERVVAVRWLLASLGCGTAAGLAGF